VFTQEKIQKLPPLRVFCCDKPVYYCKAIQGRSFHMILAVIRDTRPFLYAWAVGAEAFVQAR
jgi:hypothetical protein